MEQENFLESLDRIEDLPTLPSIAMEVNKMLQDFDTTIKDLSDLIEKDQAIVSRILKLVNSSFYGLRSEISNIYHALTLLGFNTVRNAVISVSVVNAFAGKESFSGFNITNIWTHSVALALTSRHLAEQTRFPRVDDCFIGGLLHDIGKLILSQYFMGLFEKVYTATQEKDLSFYEAEKQEIPITQTHIGGYMAKKWKLPKSLVDAIKYHHIVLETAYDLDLLLIVHTADIIVNNYKDNNLKGKLNLSAISPKARQELAPQLTTVKEWFPQLEEEIESACQFFLEQDG